VAQWNRTDRTLYAKLVYYGPALGGKTTNLRVLHRLTDPEEREKLVSVETADDRTLFFDLLPFDLGSVLGYKVAIKLYTVPGQVRYEATRRVVLAGADAVVFVADSDPARGQDNRVAWDSLRRNMRANRLDPAAVPVLVQLNKRDLPDAAPVSDMEGWLGLSPARAIPAIAFQGPGVAETFIAACRAMLERLVAMAEPATRKSLESGDLASQMERAFAPVLARASLVRPDTVAAGDRPLVLEASDLLESAIATGVALGSELADVHGRASRLSREADALRRLSDALRGTGASFDRAVVVDAALQAALTTVAAAGVALVTVDPTGSLRVLGSAGRDLSPLATDAATGPLLLRMVADEAPATVDDLAAEVSRSPSAIEGLRAVAVVPVEPEPRTALVAAMPGPDGVASDQDVRFLATLAGHLAVGLDKVRIHTEIRRHRDRLETTVRERTRELRKAYEDLKALDAMKDRFLSNVSHEMRSPLTAIIGAATVLKDYDGKREQREEMASAILHASESLHRLLDGLIRVASLEGEGLVHATPSSPAEIVGEALRLAGRDERVNLVIDPRVDSIPADGALLARAVGNLVDNAFKFAPDGAPVDIRVAPCMLTRAGAGVRGVAIAVLDRGPGVSEDEVERVFVAFEQGGDPLTGKPDGMGLGLYEARTIARRHGGTLIHLPRPGGGSEFRISLPVEAVSRLAPREALRA
jgi:signal transduction histidine kinase/signal recognition particle receptor subunit beta